MFNFNVDELFQHVDGESFPFYNLYKVGEANRIDIAVAGYTESELKVYLERTTIIVEGTKEASKEVPYKKTISSKNFKRVFALYEESKIEKVTLKYGILSILIKRVENVSKSESFKITVE